MKITIGDYDSESGTVPVTFEHRGVKHERPVNACLDSHGKYDPELTSVRVEEVGRGVERKIAMGAITNAPPPPAAE